MFGVDMQGRQCGLGMAPSLELAERLLGCPQGCEKIAMALKDSSDNKHCTMNV